MHKVVWVVIFCVLAGSADARIISVTNDPMTIGGGARPLGMGRAFAAIVDDADAPLINPAGTASFKSPQVMTMFTNLLGDVYYSEYCGALPSRRGTFGFAYVNTGVNDVLDPDIGQRLNYYDNLFLVNYSTPLATYFGYGRGLFFGVNLKAFTRGWAGGGGGNPSATGWSVDFGLKYVYNKYLSLGFNRQNLVPVDLGSVVRWTSGAEEAIAGIYKLGIAVKPRQFDKQWLLAMDVDLPAEPGRPVTAHLGTEYILNQSLAARAGYDQSVDASTASLTSWNPTLGLSLTASGFRIDYTYHPYYNEPNLATNYVSISYRGQPTYALEGEVN